MNLSNRQMCLGLFGYALAMITAGSVLMVRSKSEIDSSANQADAENQKFQSLNADYLLKKGALEFAEDAIPAAQCYTNDYVAFNQRLNTYCNGTTLSFYDLQVTFRPDETSYSSRTESEQKCILIPYTTCSSNGNGGTTCRTSLRSSCHTEYYTVTKETISKFGIMINGAGLKAEIACSRFMQNVHVNSVQFVASSTGVQRINKNNERIEDTYSSKALVKVMLDNTESYVHSVEHDRLLLDYQTTSANILQAIQLACLFIKQNLKTPAFYQDIANKTIPQLPAFRAAAEQAKTLFDAQLIVKNNANAKVIGANDAYQNQLSIWIPLIIVPTTLGMLYLCCREERVQNSFRYAAKTTSKPFVTAYERGRNSFRSRYAADSQAKDAIPVAAEATEQNNSALEQNKRSNSLALA